MLEGWPFRELKASEQLLENEYSRLTGKSLRSGSVPSNGGYYSRSSRNCVSICSVVDLSVHHLALSTLAECTGMSHRHIRCQLLVHGIIMVCPTKIWSCRNMNGTPRKSLELAHKPNILQSNDFTTNASVRLCYAKKKNELR